MMKLRRDHEGADRRRARALAQVKGRIAHCLEKVAINIQLLEDTPKQPTGHVDYHRRMMERKEITANITHWRAALKTAKAERDVLRKRLRIQGATDES